MAFFEIENLNFKYDNDYILNNFSFTLENREETIAFLGNNGAGKSTLFFVIAGAFSNFTGKIKVENKKVDAAFLRSFTGLLFQNPDDQMFMPDVESEILFTAKLKNKAMDDKKLHTEIEDILKKLDILHLKKREIFSLSGGEKKKVAIASLLIANPQMLILDEPFSNLDYKTKTEVLSILKKLKNEKTLFISTHNTKFAYEISDKVLIIQKGKVAYFGDSEILKDRQFTSKYELEPL